MNSFFHIAKKNKRCLAISLKQAYLLDAMQKDKGLKVPALDDEGILLFKKSKKRFDKWENQLIERYDKQNKIFDAHKVSSQQCKTLLALSFYDFEELVQMEPKAGSCYVLSTSEPFNEEMEIDYERLVNWLSHYGLPRRRSLLKVWDLLFSGKKKRFMKERALCMKRKLSHNAYCT